jgi:hypothetical protein
MTSEAEAALAWLRRWGVEAVLAAVALAGLAAGATGGRLLVVLLGLVLAAATADRVRLRMDNRSLAVAVEEAGERRVSAARRETPADTEALETATGGPDGRTADDEAAARTDEPTGSETASDP